LSLSLSLIIVLMEINGQKPKQKDLAHWTYQVTRMWYYRLGTVTSIIPEEAVYTTVPVIQNWSHLGNLAMAVQTRMHCVEYAA